MKIVITDCDHAGIEEEEAAAAGHGVELELRQCRTEDEVVSAGEGADGLLVQYAPITDRVLAALPDLKAVGRYGVGVDTVDVEAASRHNVAVCNVPDYGTEDVSDHAVALAVTLSRGVMQLDRGVRLGRHDLAPVRPLHRFNTRVFGVVGLGLIGSATARKARGLGFHVIGHDPKQAAGSTTSGGIEAVGLEELYARADIVSLHVPLDPRTHHLIDAAALSRFKDGSLLVNTCRGGVVDSNAVVDALRSGKLKGAGLDVFEQEPLASDHPLAGLENTVLTPHAAWYSEESYSELKRRTIENVIDFCAGRQPRNILNADALIKESVK
jgi:D-3-phosphoglycerate dehydrogenase